MRKALIDKFNQVMEIFRTNNQKKLSLKKLDSNKSRLTRGACFFVSGILGIFFAVQPTNVVLAACTYPSEVLDLSNWKHTLPTGSSKKPKEIKQTELNTYSDNAYFYSNKNCDGVTFRAPVNGVTTSGSGYPRSELREMSNNGKDMANWSTKSGTHTMYIDQAITAVPKNKKHVVAGQVHDSEDDVIVIRLEYPKLFVDINGKAGPTLDPNYTLGKRFTVQFLATEGKIKVFYNGGKDPVYTLNKSGEGNYFKAGAYTQSNCSKEKLCDKSNYGEVVIYDLEVKHSSAKNANLAVGSKSQKQVTVQTDNTAVSNNNTAEKKIDSKPQEQVAAKELPEANTVNEARLGTRNAAVLSEQESSLFIASILSKLRILIMQTVGIEG